MAQMASVERKIRTSARRILPSEGGFLPLLTLVVFMHRWGGDGVLTAPLPLCTGRMLYDENKVETFKEKANNRMKKIINDMRKRIFWQSLDMVCREDVIYGYKTQRKNK